VEILFVSNHIGNFLAGYEVVKMLRQRGHEVRCLLDPHGTAWAAHQARKIKIDGVFFATAATAAVECDVVLTTISPAGEDNLEIKVTQEAVRIGKRVCALEEVPYGWRNPGGWAEVLKRVHCLLSPMPVRRPIPLCQTKIVGPLAVERYRNVDLAVLGQQARQKMGITSTAKVVWYIAHPEAESPPALYQLGEALSECDLMDIGELVLIVTRHGREKVKPVPDNHEAHRHALRFIGDRLDIQVIDNSPDYDGSASHQELMGACSTNGVIVTGFATDGLVVAPHLAIPSILFLQRFTLGQVLKREKRVTEFPLEVIHQPETVNFLQGSLSDALCQPDRRQAWIDELRDKYPFPAVSPAEKAADIITAGL
jgi:hypothetical protein